MHTAEATYVQENLIKGVFQKIGRTFTEMITDFNKARTAAHIAEGYPEDFQSVVKLYVD